METIAIVLRRSRKKMSAEETRIDIKNPWERVEESCEKQAVPSSIGHTMMDVRERS